MFRGLQDSRGLLEFREVSGIITVSDILTVFHLNACVSGLPLLSRSPIACFTKSRSVSFPLPHPHCPTAPPHTLSLHPEAAKVGISPKKTFLFCDYPPSHSSHSPTTCLLAVGPHSLVYLPHMHTQTYRHTKSTCLHLI